MKTAITQIMGWIAILAGLAACEKDPQTPEPRIQVTFDLALQALTRAPESSVITGTMNYFVEGVQVG